MTEITNKQIEYKTANYQITVDITGDRSSVYVQTLNNNIVGFPISIKEAENLAKELLEVLEQVKI